MRKRDNPRWLDRTLVLSTHFMTLCTTERGYKKALKHLNIPKDGWPPFVINDHADASVHFFDNEDGKRAAIVCIRDFEDKDPEAVYALIVHEAVHIWQEIREHYGEKAPSSEFEAYSIQSLTLNLLTEFNRQTKGKA